MTASSDDVRAADQFAAATLRLLALADAIEAQGVHVAPERSVRTAVTSPPPVAIVDEDDAEPATFVDSAERVLRAIVSNVAIAAVAASVVLLLWAVALRVLPSSQRPGFASDPAPTAVSSPAVTPP